MQGMPWTCWRISWAVRPAPNWGMRRRPTSSLRPTRRWARSHFQMEEFGDAQREFRSAVEALPDPVAYFSLGLAYVEDEEIEDAMAAFARSVFLGGSTEGQAREMLERLYEFENDSLDGLDAYVQSEGGRIDP